MQLRPAIASNPQLAQVFVVAVVLDRQKFIKQIQKRNTAVAVFVDLEPLRHHVQQGSAVSCEQLERPILLISINSIASIRKCQSKKAWAKWQS